MQITITEDFKSVKAGVYELNNFTVLTGENGSGKTNFLKAIRAKENLIIDGKLGEILDIQYYSQGHFASVPNEENHYIAPSYRHHLNQYWKIYQAYIRKEYELQAHEVKYLTQVAQLVNKDIDNLNESDFK